MKTRQEARERAIELALEDESASQIARLLDDQGLGGLLDPSELESIVLEAKAARQMLPDRPRKMLPRIIGLIAVISGAAGMWMDTGEIPAKRYSPGGYGLLAVVLGSILILKPASANADI